MKKTIKTLALFTTGLVVGVVVGRVSTKNNVQSFSISLNGQSKSKAIKSMLKVLELQKFKYLNHSFDENDLIVIYEN